MPGVHSAPRLPGGASPWLVSAVLVACSTHPASEPAPSAGAPPAAATAALGTTTAPPPTPPDSSGHDFAEEARLLYRVAACSGEAPLPTALDVNVIARHCSLLLPKMQAFRDEWMATALPFFAAIEPPGLPRRVVYPFAGGDLVSVLAVYPDAEEITTLSLELAGDPRRVASAGRVALDASLSQLRRQLDELISGGDFSLSETLKHTQRGEIPGELGFFMVGLALHDLEPVGMRYFRLRDDGPLDYLDDAEISMLEASTAERLKHSWFPPDFSPAFANVEIVFRRRGAPASAAPRVHRHIGANLVDDELAEGGPLLRHLEAKGTVSAMTKAASYLLWDGHFTHILGYLLRHMAFMVSDSSGPPPAAAAGEGFVQETWGKFLGARIPANRQQTSAMIGLFHGQPERPMPFRFGYMDAGFHAQLLVTRRP